MTRLLIALTLAVILSCYEWQWRVTLPPLPELAPRLHAAAPEPISDNCEEVATVGMLNVYRCMDEKSGYEFMVNSFGFMMPVE